MTDEQVREWAREALRGNMSTDNGRLKFSDESLRHFARLAMAHAFEMAARAYEDEAETWKAFPQASAAKRQGARAIRALATAEKEKGND